MQGVERTQISLTEEQSRRLRGLARRKHTSMAALIRDAVDRAYPPPGRADERWARALAAVGGFRSGSSDISAEHDRELGEAFRS
ncbi:MAG: CopG family transcriptional regulator [Candidatus Limnocylindrales bacterium]